MAGLFGTFNVAKRGLFTQQKAIDVTSHNVANANTEGYSRQRAVLETTTPFAMPSLNNSIGPGQLGTGVQVSVIQRVRDEFLDYQVRSEQSTMGKFETRDKFLSQIEGIFQEPSDTGISNLIGKFFDSWQELSKHPESSNSRTVVAQQSSALADELNHTYGQLENCRSDVQLVIKDTVFQINNILDQVDSLNQQIMKVKVSGQEPNDLMDKRDLLLDNLSNEFNIDLKKKNFDTYDLSPKNTENLPEGAEKLLVRKEPNFAVSRFSYINGIEEKNNGTSLEISYLKNGDTNAQGNTIKITGISAANIDEVKRHIDECRVMWAKEDGTAYADSKEINFDDISDGTNINMDKLDKQLGLFKPDSGELSGDMTVQEDIDRYQDQMNKLAKTIAWSVNIVHTGDSLNEESTSDCLYFVNSNETTNIDNNITAENITVNKDILNDVMKINAKGKSADGISDGTRALAIAQLRDTLFNIENVLNVVTRKEFKSKVTDNFGTDTTLKINTFGDSDDGMTIDNYFKDTVDTIGIQEQQAQRIVTNQDALLGDFSERRSSISGVSIDEEMANMIQFQHAYSANAKIISTVDELLDVVVNGLKK